MEVLSLRGGEAGGVDDREATADVCLEVLEERRGVRSDQLLYCL